MSNISQFKSNFAGGARPNLFKCVVDFPSIAGNTNTTRRASFMIKAASIPASTITKIDVPYRGRNLKVAGERTFEDNWTVTVYNDTSFDLRNAFEKWMNSINSHSRNFAADAAVGAPLNYMRDLQVIQLDKSGRSEDTGIAQYRFIDAFPINVNAIELSYETDEVETFEVEFAYQYWERVGNEVITD